MNENNVSILRFIGRGTSYAFTTAFALASGYFLTTNDPTQDAILLCVPFMLSIFFFISYSICFHYADHKLAVSDEQLLVLQRESMWLYLILGISISTLIVFIHHNARNQWASFNTFLSLAFFFSLFSGYALFLFRRFRKSLSTTVRHQLIWPTILTIAFSIYYGMFFNTFSVDFTPYVPVLVLLLYFIITETLSISSKTFAAISLLLFVITIIIVALARFDVIFISPQFKDIPSAALFCLTTSAYLAVFEAWRITAHVAEKGGNVPSRSPSSVTAPQHPTESISASRKFYIATLAALTVSILIMPFVYILSNYGTVFLIGFGCHALVSFAFWFAHGHKFGSLRKDRWVVWKSVFGFVFLFILVLDSKFNFQPVHRHMTQFISWSGWAALVALTTYQVIRLLGAVVENVRTNGRLALARLFDKRINFVRLAAFSSLSICFFILLLQDIVPSESLLVYKADYAYVVYAVIIGLSLGAEIYNQILSSVSATEVVATVWGLIQATRFFTSFVIGGIVFLPGLRSENQYSYAILLALPLWFIAMGGFALNDYCDAYRDRINKPYRPIPSNRLSSDNVLALSIFLLMAGLGLAVYNVGHHIVDIFQVVFLVGVILYNFIIRTWAIAKSFYTAALCALLVSYPILSHSYDLAYLFLPLATFFFILGRETLMDLLDMKGDQMSGILTLPVLIGPTRTRIVAFGSLLLGVTLILPLLSTELTVPNIARLAAMITSMLLFLLLWLSSSAKQKRIAILFLWIPMITGLTKLCF
ncbi:MAG: UbiA family prenyltransferase [Bacteroidota bacterium]